MKYVARDEHGEIVAASRWYSEAIPERVASDDEGLNKYLDDSSAIFSAHDYINSTDIIIAIHNEEADLGEGFTLDEDTYKDILRRRKKARELLSGS